MSNLFHPFVATIHSCGLEAMSVFQAFAGNIPVALSEEDVINTFTYFDLEPPFKCHVRQSKGNSAGRDNFAILSWHTELDRAKALAKSAVMTWGPGKQSQLLQQG